MEYWVKLDDKLFVTMFEKYLCKLFAEGFIASYIFPDNDTQSDLILRLTGPFEIIINQKECSCRCVYWV